MFTIKSSTGETIISFDEESDWEFNIDKTGYINLLTQEDIDLGKVDGGKPIKKYSNQARAIEVVKEITQAVFNSHGDSNSYILPDE